jgi:N-acetylglucosamine kinase-like BadF-type ATPase
MKEALKAVFHSFDNRGPATSLTDRVTEYFAVQNIPDIIGKVYGEDHPRSVVAPLSQLVVQEAQAGDAVSQQIIEQACVEMIHSIEVCHRRLFKENHSTAIVLSGGVFKDAELFLGRFRDLSRHTLPNVVFQQTQVPPVGGAVLAGLADQQLTADPEFPNRLKEQIRERVTQ